MYLLSEMHIRVCNAQHIKCEAAVNSSADDKGVLHAQADGKKRQASASFTEFPVPLPWLSCLGIFNLTICIIGSLLVPLEQWFPNGVTKLKNIYLN
jgi:hypothetical protein